ncbi:MAG TPA: hypothetical protein VKH46_16205 [Thermoanaerobaculia bacterium]|jgi:hypothetical protein|nr:hypothetical protein [Thermoanaerobaculia bacterium]
MTIDLDGREADILRQVCESALSDLRMEVAGTENQEFRENLKRKEEFLRSLLERLGHSPL